MQTIQADHSEKFEQKDRVRPVRKLAVILARTRKLRITFSSSNFSLTFLPDVLHYSFFLSYLLWGGRTRSPPIFEAALRCHRGFALLLLRFVFVSRARCRWTISPPTPSGGGGCCGAILLLASSTLAHQVGAGQREEYDRAEEGGEGDFV